MTVSLGLDLDGVVADYESAFRKHVAAALGVPEASLGRQTSWSFAESGWLKDDNQFRELHAEAVKAGMFRTMDVLPGASEKLWQLSDAGVHIRIITHRLCVNGSHESAAGDTVAFLEAHQIPYRDLCFMADKPLVGADVYLDDAPHNIAKLRAAGGYAIVFDQPYNQDVPGPRARDWDEAHDLILAVRDRLGAAA